jgi:hypothetical protein
MVCISKWIICVFICRIVEHPVVRISHLHCLHFAFDFGADLTRADSHYAPQRSSLHDLRHRMDTIQTKRTHSIEHTPTHSLVSISVALLDFATTWSFPASGRWIPRIRIRIRSTSDPIRSESVSISTRMSRSFITTAAPQSYDAPTVTSAPRHSTPIDSIQ